MPKKLDTFEFPHGGRKGLDYDFAPLCDGSIWELERGVDFPIETTADTFLGALSRYANQRNLRVSKHVSDDKNTVTVRVKPKKEKKTEDGSPSEPARRGRPRKAAA